MRAVIASGSGRYADPWHHFDRTSLRLSEILREAGFSVDIDTDVDHAMTALSGVDLLVVNTGDPWRDMESVDGPAVAHGAPEAFAGALRSGLGVLSMHCAVASLRDYPEWATAVGAIWLPTVSHHPPIGTTVIRSARFPDGNRGNDFEVVDERYCRLQHVGRSTAVAHHEGISSLEPTAWVRTWEASRIAVDVLGHDERSYESAGHRDLIGRLARWTTDKTADVNTRAAAHPSASG